MESPALAHFVGAYLHQDWRSEFADEWKALDEFLSGEATYAAALRSEIERLLRLSDPALEGHIDRLSLDYRPEEGYRTWLQQVGDYIHAHTH